MCWCASVLNWHCRMSFIWTHLMAWHQYFLCIQVFVRIATVHMHRRCYLCTSSLHSRRLIWRGGKTGTTKEDQKYDGRNGIKWTQNTSQKKRKHESRNRKRNYGCDWIACDFLKKHKIHNRKNWAYLRIINKQNEQKQTKIHKGNNWAHNLQQYTKNWKFAPAAEITMCTNLFLC